MPDINIKVQGKIAQVQGAPTIVCGNSDYSAVFEFDSEWADYETKTLRVVWIDSISGEMKHEDILFSGTSAEIPVIYRTDHVLIGVYAGDIHTTTPACIPCSHCITEDSPLHEMPNDDVYSQLLAYLESFPGDVSFGTPSIALYGAIAGGAFIPIPSNGWEYVQETIDAERTSATLTIDANAPCLLLVCTMHRPDVSIDNNGWTKVVESAGIDPTTINQRMTVWAKAVSAGEYTATVTCATYGRITMKMICLYGAASLAVTANTVIDSVPYTPPAKIGKRRLYMLTSTYASSDTSEMAVTVSNTGTLDLQQAEEQRFSVFYDYQPTKNTVPDFSYFEPIDYGGYMNALVLDVTEVE